MKKVLVAFDVDGTLRNNVVPDTQPPVANENVRTVLVLLSKMKNVSVLVWSGGGELYARQVCAHLGIDSYVDRYADKGYAGKDEKGNHLFTTDIRPDIAIDDIQDCELGLINLIVREK